MEKIILIVDDNVELINGVKFILEQEGYQVLSATNGKEALTVLERITPDLILTDIMMPEMDGYELYDRVHQDERWVQVPFIFLTAKTDKEDIRRGKEMGADDYITKPFDPEDIVTAIRGRVKRLSEVKEHAASQNAGFWNAKLGPIPIPALAALALLAIVILALIPLLSSPSRTSAEVISQTREDIDGMITIPAGEFVMGDASIGNQRTVELGRFQIDKYEVVNAQYQQFAEETDHKTPWGTYPAELADYPVTGVSWEDAQAYCEWAGKRLPSEAEWEKAARGDDGRIYPWGDAWQEGVANTQESGVENVQAVGGYEAGISPYGVHDMAGNAAEWVNDWFDAEQQAKIIRGGSANAVQKWAQTFSRNQAPPNFSLDSLGFRCAN